MRQFGRTHREGMKFIFRPGAYAILPTDGKFLLTFQAGTHQEFQLPGGGIDAGETPISALHREVMEETGWRISAPRKLTAYRRFVFMPEYDVWAEKICHIFVARPARQICAPLEKGHSFHLVTASDAVRMLSNDVDRDILRAAFSL